MTDRPDPPVEQVPVDVDPILDVLERYLLGGPRTLTRLEVAERAGVPSERSETLWRALGFSRLSDDDVYFGEADVHALQVARDLFAIGLVDQDQEAALVRTLGRSYARLAEWQTRLFADVFSLTEEVGPDVLQTFLEQYVPMIEELQGYVWRRALLAAAGRMLLHPAAEEGVLEVVGFADIVGYTSQSRRLTGTELEELVEHFEAVALAVVTDHEGRIIKTIGDEILFVADDAEQAARIALALVEASDSDEAFPRIRVGMAYGPVLERLGDVYGSVVNLASRLTTVARPGRVLIDRELREELRETDEFVVRRMRRTSVKGFDRLEPYLLRRSES